MEYLEAYFWAWSISRKKQKKHNYFVFSIDRNIFVLDLSLWFRFISIKNVLLLMVNV